MTVPAQFRDVHEVIDARAVTSLFQPLVELSSGRVVGYEALSRGPAGTPWEAPIALFAAAREVGREAELDWVCRAGAYRAALDAAMGRSTTLFVNMEPTAWRTSCPPDLQPVIDRARDRLRVVTEMTERAIAADPPALLAATASSRAAGWGVALDDVGAEPLSLALMPFVQPDIVKLDMSLLRRPYEPHTAQVVNAVLAYAESTGALILAEGIETAQHLLIAQTMGAVLGQGWYYGRPAPLPNHLVTPGTPLRLLALPPAAAPDARNLAPTPYSIVAAARPVVRTAKELLMPASRYLEEQARQGEQPPVLLACFQELRHFTPATARRFSAIAARSPLVAALGVGLSGEPVAGVRGAHLQPDDPLRREWNVVVVGPHHAAALVALDLGDDGPDGKRRFDHVITHDRALVVEAARSLLHWLSPIPPRRVGADPRTLVDTA